MTGSKGKGSFKNAQNHGYSGSYFDLAPGRAPANHSTSSCSADGLRSSPSLVSATGRVPLWTISPASMQCAHMLSCWV